VTPTGVRFYAFRCASVRDLEYDCPVLALGWTGSIPVAGSIKLSVALPISPQSLYVVVRAD